MLSRTVACRTILALAVLGILSAATTNALAQSSTTATSNRNAGVVIDAQGLLQAKMFADPGGAVTRERVQAAMSNLPADIRAFSKMRKVSLNRLEKELVRKQGVLGEDMRYLAGLQRVKWVFFYPESNDIVIAGPAEGWLTDPAGRVVGLTSGRPVIQLQDMAVALRAFPPGASPTSLVGCSIDPTKEGLASLQAFLQRVGSYATPADTQRLVTGLRSSLGLQMVSVNGISPKTNMARVLVEADYRMKLIGIGLEQPPVKMVSFIEKANPSSINRNALFRWYFVPDYQCVRVSADGLGMELVGDGVKLVGEDEMVAVSSGERAAAGGKANPASLAFVNSFTKKYTELAEKSPVYAELRNVIDMLVAAAFIQQHDYYGKANWRMEFLGNESSYAVELYNAPKQVESAVAAIWRGNRLTTPIGGGVHIEPGMALRKENRLADEKGDVANRYQQTKVNLPEGRWWWD